MNPFTPDTNTLYIQIFFRKATDLFSIYTERIRKGIASYLLRINKSMIDLQLYKDRNFSIVIDQS